MATLSAFANTRRGRSMQLADTLQRTSSISGRLRRTALPFNARQPGRPSCTNEVKQMTLDDVEQAFREIERLAAALVQNPNAERAKALQTACRS